MRLKTITACLYAILMSSTHAQTPDTAPQRIYFTKVGPGYFYNVALFVADPDGSDERPFAAASAPEYNPAWSADAQWVVFTSERDGQAEIYRIRADGTGPERLTDHPAYDDQAALSPDGRHIVFVTTRADATADLWLMDVAERDAKPLTSGPGGDFRPAWSPDGQWIAFSSDRASDMPAGRGRWEHLHLTDIYVIRADGSQLRRLTRDGNNAYGSPKWSRDGRELIAYRLPAESTLPYSVQSVTDGATEIVSIDVATDAVHTLSAGPGVKLAPVLLPSGVLGYVRRDADGRGLFYNTGRAGPAGNMLYAAWSPDGSQVVYERVARASTLELPGRKVWSRDQRYELIETLLMPSFHPSGERFVTTAQAPEGLVLMIIESETSASRVLFHRDGASAIGPTWSPRGDVIVFGVGAFTLFTRGVSQQVEVPEDRVEGGGQVAVIGADGTGFRELTSGANNNSFPSFAPDGERLVYRTFGPEGNGLRITSLSDRSVRALTTGYDNFPVWSPRGDLIAFSRRVDGDFEIFTIRPDGTDLHRLTTSRGNDSHLGWSPDGEWIAFTSSRAGFKDEALYTLAPQPYGEIFVMRRNGDDVHQLTDNQWEDGAPAWQLR